MKLQFSMKTNLKIKEAQNKVDNAAEKSFKDTVVDIANDAIRGSPKKTGNNMRSIKYEAEGLSGAIYSTSGYGGYLETGYHTKSGRHISGRPYFKPALDRNIHKLPEGMKAELR